MILTCEQHPLDGKTGTWDISLVKTTVDLPDSLFRRAKATSASQGVSLKAFITQSIERQLNAEEKDWRAVLDHLPRVDQETSDQIMLSVAESDAMDFEFQRHALKVEH